MKKTPKPVAQNLIHAKLLRRTEREHKKAIEWLAAIEVSRKYPSSVTLKARALTMAKCVSLRLAQQVTRLSDYNGALRQAIEIVEFNLESLEQDYFLSVHKWLGNDITGPEDSIDEVTH